MKAGRYCHIIYKDGAPKWFFAQISINKKKQFLKIQKLLFGVNPCCRNQ